MDHSLFRPRTLIALILVGVLGFAGMILVNVFRDAFQPTQTAGPNPFSFSAIGHKGFVTLLEAAGLHVVISRNESEKRAGSDNLLVLVEPHKPWHVKSATSLTILLVLPKRIDVPHPSRRSWVGNADLMPVETVQDVLHAFFNGKVVRPAKPSPWVPNDLGDDPTIDDLQLVRSDYLDPIIQDKDGRVLFGEYKLSPDRLFVLSDPDLLNNFGLGRGDNARLAYRIIERSLPENGAVVFDTVVHGFASKPSPWKALFTLPYGMVTFCVIISILIVIWSATGRFGAPRRTGKTEPIQGPPLIDNAARLMTWGKHDRAILERYFQVVRHSVAEALHAPRGLSDEDFAKWLDRAGDARGVRDSYETVRREAEILMWVEGTEAKRILRAARLIDRWKREMLNGNQ